MTPRRRTFGDQFPRLKDDPRFAELAARPMEDSGRPPSPEAADLDLRLAADAELCPAASNGCGCGVGPARWCGHPDRPAEVRAADCRLCRARAWWEAGVG